MQGSVIFLAGENPDDLRCRLYAACQTYSLEADKLPLYVLPNNFPMTPDAVELLKQHDYNRIHSALLDKASSSHSIGRAHRERRMLGYVTNGATTLMKCSIDWSSWPRSRLPWKLIWKAFTPATSR